jgi:hypothetical protein
MPKLVTFTGATPSAGGGNVGGVQVEDKNGKVAEFPLGVEVEVSDEHAALAQKVEGHNFDVKPAGSKNGG